MALAVGTRLGPYEVAGPLGAGGMGEVYRARDTRLDRTVAVKVLPTHLSSNPDLKQRFEREARAISALNHPHICHLYDVGSQDGTDFLVMEYLEGETLANRLQKGPLPLGQVSKIGMEIAEALDKAHRQGIIHRDLKPGNIMLTSSGAKLMDFGLAKTAAAVGGVLGAATVPLTPSSPTVSIANLASQPSPLTQKGAVVGTFQYIAPETLQGKECDARSDIFSLGCVLYEMTTGRPAFTGKSQLSVITAILEKDPEPLSASQPLAPPILEHIVDTCLAKNPEDRFQTAHDIGLQLKWIENERIGSAATPARRLNVWTWAAIAGLVLLGLMAVAIAYLQRGPESPQVVRSYILPPEKSEFTSPEVDSGPVVISPDGRRIAFSARDPQGRRVLWVRPLNSTKAELLHGTEDATYPFWSPDSRYLGFFAEGKLRKIDASGGPSETLGDVSTARGGSWGPDGTILFAAGLIGPLQRVPAAGGTPSEATKLETDTGILSHRWPYFLPDGHHFLYLASGGTVTRVAGIYLGDLNTKNSTLLIPARSNAVYAPPGYLLYTRDANLLAQPFDAQRLRLTGDPKAIAENVSANLTVSRGAFSASNNGILVYQGGGESGKTELMWFDHAGKQLGKVGEPGDYGWARISPDGKRVAVQVVTVDSSQRGIADIWVIDLARGTRTRLTFGPGTSFSPVWSPDGTKIYYSAGRNGPPHIYARAANGTGSEELVYSDGADDRVRSISTDGRYLFFERTDSRSSTDTDIWVLPTFGDRKAFPLVATQSAEWNPMVSPDGRWVAYLSNESGRFEMYVTSFPGAGSKWQVSTGGGHAPRWRPDGKELYYLAEDGQVMAVEVSTSGSGLSLGVAHALFRASPVRSNVGPIEVSPDGKRFLVNTTLPGGSGEPATLVINWPTELKK